MIIRGNPLGRIILFFIISLILIYTSATFWLWVVSIIIIILMYSARDFYFIIENEKIVVKNYTYFWFYKEFKFLEIEKIHLIDGSYGQVHVKINNKRYAIGGRSIEYLQKRFSKLKEKGIDVEVKSWWESRSFR